MLKMYARSNRQFPTPLRFLRFKLETKMFVNNKIPDKIVEKFTKFKLKWTL